MVGMNERDVLTTMHSVATDALATSGIAGSASSGKTIARIRNGLTVQNAGFSLSLNFLTVKGSGSQRMRPSHSLGDEPEEIAHSHTTFEKFFNGSDKCTFRDEDDLTETIGGVTVRMAGALKKVGLDVLCVDPLDYKALCVAHAARKPLTSHVTLALTADIRALLGRLSIECREGVGLTAGMRYAAFWGELSPVRPKGVNLKQLFDYVYSYKRDGELGVGQATPLGVGLDPLPATSVPVEPPIPDPLEASILGPNIKPVFPASSTTGVEPAVAAPPVGGGGASSPVGGAGDSEPEEEAAEPMALEAQDEVKEGEQRVNDEDARKKP
jgi:hypothetical protein